MGLPHTEHRIVLDNDLGELERLDVFVREFGGAYGLNEDQVFALALCLEEAVANIIMHGGKSERPATQIRVTLQEIPLTASIEDDGAPFDPTDVPAPAMAASLHEAQAGGLGVHIMRQFTSNLRYQRIEGSNRLTLEFAAKPQGHAASRDTR